MGQNDLANQMLCQWIIEQAASPWSSNVVLFCLEDNEYKFCIDYLRLNAVTYKGAYPLPHTELAECSHCRQLVQYFGPVFGYWQVLQDLRDADNTAFITRRGCFQFCIMSFCLTNVPSVFQRLVDFVLASLARDVHVCVIDDSKRLQGTRSSARNCVTASGCFTPETETGQMCIFSSSGRIQGITHYMPYKFTT